MNISTLSIKRPVLAIVMNLIIILFGIIGYTFLGVREFPSIDPPVITVRTSYPGANARVIEAEITDPLEKVINGISGIRSITSASNQGSSEIKVEFELGVDLETARNDVSDKVSQAMRNLPKDIDGIPTVQKADANSDAIVSMTIQNDSLTHMELSDFAENVVAQRLQTIEGVSSIQIWGQKKYAMRLRLNPEKMAATGITALDVKTALDRENIELPAGKMAGNATELNINVVGKLKTVDEFNELIIRNENGRLTRMKDIGFAEMGTENEETVLRSSGIPMIGLGLVPQPGSNYIAIANEFYKRYDKLKAELPKGYKLDIALDNTVFIENSLEEVKETLLIAIILVVLIIYLFFRDWVVAFRPLIDIPVSLIGTFFIMYLCGFSINILTLLAVVLATGLVVDDGIVVTENIYKKIEKGMSPKEAAIKGSAEIMFAVISTSLTLAAVFLPIVFMTGFVGELFTEFGVVLASAVLISAFVSLTLTPMLNAYMVRKTTKKSRFYERTEPFFIGMEERYRNAVTGFIKQRWWAWVIVPFCVFIGLYYWFTLPAELAPLEDRGWFRIGVTAPEGASFEYTDAYMQKLSDFIEDSIPEKKFLLTVTAPGFTGSGAVNTGMIRLRFVPSNERVRTQQDLANYFTAVASGFPEGRISVNQEQTISVGNSSRGATLQYVIQAPNFDSLRKIVPVFLDSMMKDPVLVGPDVNLKFNKPEIELVPDVEKANAVGLTENDIAQSLQYNLSGIRFGYFNMNGKQYQVMGQVERVNRNDPSDLTGLYVRNKDGKLIQLDNVVKRQELSSPPQLYRYNRYVSATVSANIAPGRTMGDAAKTMKRIQKNVLGPSFSMEATGPARDYEESSSNFIYTFILSLLLIYLVLSAQFESFSDPFIIIMTVPLAFAGALFSLWYFNQTNNIFSQIGLIMLIGLVTKNGILIVEFANQLREQGQERTQAAINAAVSRLRPILMTSIATALGALPIAMALGSGSVSRMGMGIVVVGGILFSLILTLFVVPAMYTFLSKKKYTSHA